MVKRPEAGTLDILLPSDARPLWGHEGRFPPHGLNGRYRFRKRSVAVSDCRPGLLRQALRAAIIAPSPRLRRRSRSTDLECRCWIGARLLRCT